MDELIGILLGAALALVAEGVVVIAGLVRLVQEEENIVGALQAAARNVYHLRLAIEDIAREREWTGPLPFGIEPPDSNDSN